MAEDKNTLELISSITEFNDLHERRIFITQQRSP